MSFRINPRKGLRRLLPLALAAVVTPAAALDLSLEASLEYRHFPEDAPHPAQHRDYGSLALAPEVYADWDNRDQSVTLRLFGRLDRHDDRRTHADVREAFYRYTARDFEWRVGVQREFWGVLESAHLVDTINQSDFVEDIAGEAKLGQPMVNLAWFAPVGTVDFYLMPVFRERTFPAEDGRPRPLLPVSTAAARTDDDGLDAAVRYFGSFGRLDVGLSWFHGTGRDPRFDTIYDACDVSVRFNPLFGLPLIPPVTLGCDRARAIDPGVLPPWLPRLIEGVDVTVDAPRFAPVYDRIDQAGIDLQYVRGALSLKAEAIHRRAREFEFTAAGVGLEYTLYDLFGSGYDLGLLAEYLYDERGRLDRAVAEAAARLAESDTLRFDSIREARAFQVAVDETQNAAILQDDLFLGGRLAFNDLAGSEILAGAVRDLETGALFANLEASRRFLGSYRAALTGRFFFDIPVTDPLYGFRDDDYLAVTVTRFF
ncbi:hypothetical protein PC39_03517 [Salinisphaera sp. PC39]|uniref:hypothetical protein n=1 Tax=Salinisphaera sp. PC39 TaxID=1304156 RepID=UPI003340048F